jgi:hypothetical protein
MMQLPRRLHSGVNSPWSPAFTRLTAMNNLLEMWSHPWHALQQRLAMSVGADADREAPRPAAAGAADAGSWLTRALNAAPPQPNSRHE